MRFPTTNGQQIALLRRPALHGRERGGVAAASRAGWVTRRSAFFPDGKQLAFTSQYDGNTEVYVMPGDGGEPKRLTTTATLGRDDISDRMGPTISSWVGKTPSRPCLAHAAPRSTLHRNLDRRYGCRTAKTIARSRGGLSPSLRMTQKWRSTASFANSGPGNIIAAAWSMTSGFVQNWRRRT